MRAGLLTFRVKLAALFAAMLVATGIFLVGYFPDQMYDVAERWAERGSLGTTEAAASLLGAAVELEQVDWVDKRLAELTERPGSGVLYSAVLRPDGSVLGNSGADDYSTVIEGLARIATESVPQTIDGILHVVSPIDAKSGHVGYLIIGFSLAQLEQDRSTYESLVTLVAALLVAIAMALSLAAGTILVRPIRELTRITTNIVERGDLGQEITIRSNDEVGMLADSFREMVTKIRAIPLTLGDFVEDLSALIDQLSETGRTVKEGAEQVRNHVAETTQTMHEMLDSIRSASQTVEKLQNNAQESAQSNIKMANSNRDTQDSVVGMVASVELTNAAVEQMIASINETAGNVRILHNSIDDTLAAMLEITGNIEQVEVSARDSATISKRVSKDSDSGVTALKSTIGGIDRIRQSSETVSSVINDLGNRVGRIDDILDVITDITEQTNLLALNAAITAAQAGEHGRGFAVVANEIKALSKRTADSTREISSLIIGIRESSSRASTAMHDGRSSVDEGVELGQQASEALSQISNSATRATTMMSAIVQATELQSSATKRVGSSVQDIYGVVQQINTASTHQADGTDELRRLVRQMLEMTDRVRHSSDAQQRDSATIASSVATITSAVDTMNHAQGAQAQASERVLKSVQAVQNITDRQRSSVDSLDAAIARLRERADALGSAVREFKL